MSCERLRTFLRDTRREELSPEAEGHLSGCEPCREALAVEQALLARIDAELQVSLETPPSPAFLPGVRRRVGEVRARRQATRRRWLVPAMATLAGVLVAGHFIHNATRGPGGAVSVPVSPATSPVGPRPVRAVERVDPAPVPAPAPEAAPPAARREPDVVPPQPRVFVPPEDAQVVRRLARRLRGRAARAAVLTVEVEGPHDFALAAVDSPGEELSLDARILQGAEPGLEEPQSFDRTVEKERRDT